MCTVTLFPRNPNQRGGPLLRVACNRDESRTRPTARPPELRTFGERRALLPIDPASDGTWLAVNDAGLVLAVLNSNPVPASETHSPSVRSARGLRSRGVIIPGLLGCASIEAAALEATRLNLDQFPLFRLLIADARWVVELHSIEGSMLAVNRWPLSQPRMFTSSGLGDARVEGPRRQLFEQMLGDLGESAAMQDAFHRHRWPETPEISVWMCRDEALTVSHTLVELREDSVAVAYSPVSEAGIGAAVVTTMSLTGADRSLLVV